MIKFVKNIALLTFFMCFVLITNAQASDDNIFKLVVAKSSQVLMAARNLSFVIAGLGLIVFSWGAIFGKISWKHFFNIAIGLFLLSAMGAFISFFVTKSGNKDEVVLRYGNHLPTGDSLTTYINDTTTTGTLPRNEGASGASGGSGGESLNDSDDISGGFYGGDDVTVEEVVDANGNVTGTKTTETINGGTVTTVENADGSSSEVYEREDGSIQIKSVDANGNQTIQNYNADGTLRSDTTSEMNEDGTLSSSITKDGEGNTISQTKSEEQLAQEAEQAKLEQEEKEAQEALAAEEAKQAAYDNDACGAQQKAYDELSAINCNDIDAIAGMRQQSGYEAALVELENGLEELKEQRDAEYKSLNVEIAAKEKEVETLEEEIAARKAGISVESHTDKIKELEKQIKDLEDQVKDVSKAYDDGVKALEKSDTLKNATKAFEDLRKSYCDTAEDAVKDAKKALEDCTKQFEKG